MIWGRSLLGYEYVTFLIYVYTNGVLGFWGPQNPKTPSEILEVM